MKRVSAFAIMAVVCSLIAIPAIPVVSAAGALAASSRPVTQHGARGHGVRLAVSARGVAGLRTVRQAAGSRARRLRLPFRSPGGSFPAVRGRRPRVPKPSASALAGSRPGTVVAHAFNGLSNSDSTRLNGFPLTPPDQGLCAGHDPLLRGNPRAIWELVNAAARESTPDGRRLRPDISLATLSQDPSELGDPRCLWDPATRSFYFTEIGFPVATGPNPDLTNTTVDVVVLNARGVAAYQFDTSLGGQCFGDQPKTGFDNNALIVSTDEFCGPDQADFEGSIVLAISKSQLVAQRAVVSDAVLGPVSLAATPITGLDPAIDTGTGTTYLVNSFPFQANGQNNPAASTLGLWTLRNDASVTTGHGSPALAGRLIRSQIYSFPVPAASTGDGSTHLAQGQVITSEAFLNPDDSRISGPVNVTRTPGGIRLWTALSSALTPRGDSAIRDGAAWFQIDPAAQRVVTQGYVAARGAYLIYPAMLSPGSGPAAMVFTATSTRINPAAAFTTLGSATIGIVAPGAGPHLSSDNPPAAPPRWGDYSFAVPDPDGPGIWLATEYIPPRRFQNPIDNWGTYVFEVR
jgi:hypothetical protein